MNLIGPYLIIDLIRNRNLLLAPDQMLLRNTLNLQGTITRKKIAYADSLEYYDNTSLKKINIVRVLDYNNNFRIWVKFSNHIKNNFLRPRKNILKNDLMKFSWIVKTMIITKFFLTFLECFLGRCRFWRYLNFFSFFLFILVKNWSAFSFSPFCRFWLASWEFFDKWKYIYCEIFFLF